VQTAIALGATDGFDPKTIVALDLAFEMALALLAAEASPHVVPWRLDDTKEALASRIIATAKAGKRDANVLTEDAIAFLQVTKGPSSPRFKRRQSAVRLD